MDTKFGKDVSNEILLNTAKFQGYSFYRFTDELFISGFQELIQLESTFEYAYRIGLFDKG